MDGSLEMTLLDQFGKCIVPRKTFGEQAFDNAIKQIESPDKYEVGETVNELWKDLNRKMQDGIEKARKKGYKGILYIQIIEKKLPENMQANGDMYMVVVRSTRPTPEQATSLYIHKLGEAQPKFQYCLPELSWVESIMRNKTSGKFTEKYINDIQAWIEGRLV